MVLFCFFFSFKFQISCLSICWVCLFHFRCFFYLLILLNALSVLLERVLWNNIGAFGFYWYAHYSTLMESYQRPLHLWLRMFCGNLYQGTGYQVLLLVSCNERGNGKFFNWASLRQRCIFLTKESRLSNLIELSAYCGQHRGDGWLCHHVWYFARKFSLGQQLFTTYSYGDLNFIAAQEKNIYRTQTYSSTQFTVLNEAADSTDLWKTTLNESKCLEFIISREAPMRRNRSTRRDGCLFKDTCFLAFTDPFT